MWELKKPLMDDQLGPARVEIALGSDKISNLQ